MSPQTRRIAALFRPHRARLATVLGLIAISAGLGMVAPFLLKAVLDELSPTATRPCWRGSSAG